MLSEHQKSVIRDQFSGWYANEARPGPLGYVESTAILNEVFKLVDAHLQSPHLRGQLPREALTIVIKDLIRCILENAEHMKSDKVMDTLLSVDVIQNNAEKTIITIERLVNGVSRIKPHCLMKTPPTRVWCIEQCAAYRECYSEKVCKTCGGSRRKCTLLSNVHPIKNSCDMEPCPDCKPKVDHDSPGHKCSQCNVVRGAQRRQGPSDRRNYANRRHEPDHGRTYATQRGGRRVEQRRK